MNENLNLVDILRDCPRGTKLYSIPYGEVEFYQIVVGNTDYPICFEYKNKKGDTYMATVTVDGKYADVDGECILFPSKENRDWSKFNIEPELIDGEIYYARNDLSEWIYIYKRNNTFKTNHYAALFNDNLMIFDHICTIHNEDIKVLRKATEEEKDKLKIGLGKYNLKIDEKKKELIKIESKFDINTLKPFDKVLVRDWDDSVWRCNIYEYYKKDQCYPFITMNGVCNQCVPYNDETKHLVGTTKMPPKKYITWEE